MGIRDRVGHRLGCRVVEKMGIIIGVGWEGKLGIKVGCHHMKCLKTHLSEFKVQMQMSGKEANRAIIKGSYQCTFP